MQAELYVIIAAKAARVCRVQVGQNSAVKMVPKYRTAQIPGSESAGASHGPTLKKNPNAEKAASATAA